MTKTIIELLRIYGVKLVSKLSGIRGWIASKILDAILKWLEKKISYTLSAIKAIWLHKREVAESKKDAKEYYEKVHSEEVTQKELDDATSQALNGKR